jgi:hypothetical protein
MLQIRRLLAIWREAQSIQKIFLRLGDAPWHACIAPSLFQPSGSLDASRNTSRC